MKLKSRLIRTLILLLTCCALGGELVPFAHAHHSFAMFDKAKRVTLEGVVSKVEWANPHVYVFIDVPDGKGSHAQYSLECKSPNMLTRLGWKPNTLKVGDAVSAEVFLLKSGAPGGLLDAVKLRNGVRIKG